MEFIDIHTHVLPEVDDGARSLEEAILIISEARDAGVRKMLLTPHFFADRSFDSLDRVPAQFRKLQAETALHAPGVELHLGAELMIHPDLPELIKKEKHLTVNGSGKYILFELPMSEIPFYAFDVCFRLLTSGVKLVWAHPERCSDVIRDPRVIQGYVDNGVLLQIDAGSLIGLNGRRIKHAAESMVKKGHAHVLASDVHRSGEVKGLLTEAFTCIKRLAGERKAVEMCYSTPAAIVKD